MQTFPKLTRESLDNSAHSDQTRRKARTSFTVISVIFSEAEVYTDANVFRHFTKKATHILFITSCLLHQFICELSSHPMHFFLSSAGALKARGHFRSLCLYSFHTNLKANVWKEKLWADKLSNVWRETLCSGFNPNRRSLQKRKWFVFATGMNCLFGNTFVLQ